MSFLTPLFLAGLAAIAVPVIIHLIQKERKQVVAFPSLMFLRKIPYQSVQRRRIRNWPLLLLRLAALALIVLAFARPFLRRESLAAAAAGGAREVVILLDRSYSLGYGDRWERAIAAAKDAVNGLGPVDRASVVLFDTGAEVALRSTGDKARLTAVLEAAAPGAAATRYGPALKLAGSLLAESGLPNRDVLLVSDFQRLGWQGGDGVRLPEGVVVTPVAVGDAEVVNASVMPVVLHRTAFSGQERVAVTAGALNHAARPARVTLTLEVDGRTIENRPLTLEPRTAGTVSFTPFTPASAFTRGTVRLSEDLLARDNAFHFVVSPRERLKVLIVERPGGSRAASLYLAQALALSETPPFEVVRKTMDTVAPGEIDAAAVIVLNDVPVSQAAAERLGAFVRQGGGLFVAFGERGAWPAAVGDVMPVTAGATADRTRGSAGRLGALEYAHPVFEGFRAPRSGDFSAARFYNYRAVTVAPDAQILARYDDGAPALVERRVGQGRVMAWTSTLDVAWNDLALKPVFLPFIHRVATTLAAYTQQPASVKVGDVLPVPSGSFVVTPSGERLAQVDTGALELREQGFYEIRAGGGAGEVRTVASNVDLAESDLTAMEPGDVAAGATGRAGGATAAGPAAVLTDAERERTQRVWWYLLFAGLVLLAVEPVAANAVRTRYV
ncbi:MAG TPA: BatA domain-containing protein [Vicinamibacterales bacterium]|nr:BatA domain-containing protein [Vicinamibacterales bacterium]